MKQQKTAVLTERDKRARILRTMVRRVAREFDNHELVCLSNAHADLLVEFVERVCDRLGGTPMKKQQKTAVRSGVRSQVARK